MRDWLTVIIVLLIIGIVLDGIRRMRQSRRENLSLSKNALKADESISDSAADENDFRSEFPSGSARVVERRDKKDAENITQSLRENFEATKTTVGAPQRIPEQVSLNLEESVPMLMDSVEDEVPENEPEVIEDAPTEELVEQNEPAIGDLDSLEEVSATPKTEPKRERTAVKEKAVSTNKVERKEPEVEATEPDEVLIINVMAHSGQRFQGEALLEALMSQSLKLGSMDIFHRHANEEGDGPVLFSLANMVVPGTFNLATMNEFETPGVSLFLSLPIEGLDEDDGESIAAYDTMVKTARHLAEQLDGELKDENRSVMTQQTIEHGRQRVVEYERKRKLYQVT